MRRILSVFLALALVACAEGQCVSIVGACGGGIDPETLARAQAAQCTSLSFEDLDEISGEVVELLLSIGGVIPPNATYSIATGDYTITLSIGLLAGIVTSSDDLSDGIGPGEAATATWELNGGLAGTARGEGVFTLARTSTTDFTVGGDGSTSHGTCEFDFTSINLAFDTASSLGPIGNIAFTGTSGGSPISGNIVLDGSDTALVSSRFDGKVLAFTIDLDTFLPSI